MAAMSPAFAQEDDESEDEADETDRTEEIVVTGSRLRRDTFTSIAPLQVISGQVSREIGLIDAGQILQESTAASGQQIDLTFGGFVLDNGPAATTVDLRGLGANRTLVLVNGRRLAPAGVEGAPTSPDANLIPSSMIQQIEVLLDGASSIYGSDAVAGVVNVILKKDFDGFQIEGYSGIPAAGDTSGIQNQISANWGYNGDRGFIGVGVEFNDLEAFSLADRDWFGDCERHAEITTNGEVRTEDLFYSTVFGQRSPGECKISSLAGFVTELGPPQFGSMFYQAGQSNIGVPNLSDYFGFGTVIDLDQDGFADVSFVDYSFNGNAQYEQVFPNIETTALLSYGEYTFAGEANLTPYYELQYNRRESDYLGGPGNIAPVVPPGNPFNPCNPNGLNGVDCGLASDALLDNPVYAADFAAVNGLTPAQFRDMGIVNLYRGAVGAIPMQAVPTVRGDRDNVVTDIDQLRIVGGIRGDIPFMNFGPVRNWTFDLYVSDTESDGDSSRVGIRSDRLDLALGNYSTTNTPCENNTVPASELADDALPGCVPVNMFAPSLYANPVNNDFETEAERTYLFDSRDFRTKYRQTIYSYYMNGDVFELPAGDVKFGLGAEYREDEIESIPDQVAADGLLIQFFVDRGAVGEKYTREFFGELEAPLLAGKPAFEELTVNLSSRYTKDEFYGGAWTYSGKLAWRPVDSLVLRATTGTSYRAPNLRENFLAGQTGFLQVTDPCVVPDAAFDPVTGYNPALDNRSPEVIANCIADPNVDPFTFTNGGAQLYFVEVSEGGALDLQEEKSEAWSTNVTWEQPFFNQFDLVIGATYYEIDVRQEIIDPSAPFIINDCYTDAQGDSAFCSRITRDPAASDIVLIDESFINRDRLQARGVDVNLRFEWPVTMFGRAVDLGADLAFNRTLEISEQILSGPGETEIEEFQGEPGFPDWKGRMDFRADVGKFRYTWSTRYIGSVKQDEAEVDDFDDIFGIADTCLGEANGDVDCRDIGFIDNYFTHTASVYYRGDTWTIGAGVRNIFDEEPPFVDGSEILALNNRPIGYGYDIYGRQVFLNVVYNTQ